MMELEIPKVNESDSSKISDIQEENPEESKNGIDHKVDLQKHEVTKQTSLPPKGLHNIGNTCYM